jgi:hypothetical protein
MTERSKAKQKAKFRVKISKILIFGSILCFTLFALLCSAFQIFGHLKKIVRDNFLPSDHSGAPFPRFFVLFSIMTAVLCVR